MKDTESKNATVALRDKAIIVAAGVTIVGIVFWLKQSGDTRQLAAATSDEQQKLRATLERLAATIERIEAQMQTLVAAQDSVAVMVSASARQPTPAASKRTAAASDSAAPAQSARRRQPSNPKTTRNRSANSVGAGQAAQGAGTEQAAKEAE